MIKKLISVGISTGLLLSVLCSPVSASNRSATAKLTYDNTYNRYLESNGEADVIEDATTVSYNAATPLGGTVLGEYGGKTGVYVLANPGDGLKCNMSVEKEGYYYVSILYTGIADNDKSIRVELTLDGSIPFFEAGSLELNRCYSNNTNDFKTDSLGNELRPEQKQQIYWQETPLYQNDVGSQSPYCLYMSAGEHSIGITAANGGICIASISLKQMQPLISYKDYSARHSQQKAGNQKDVYLQGEKAEHKSDISLYPLTDRTSCATQPFSESKIVLNSIGGTNWSNPGDWIEWSFEIKSAGLYEIAMRVRQNTNQGMRCYRSISINGEVPFTELANYGFRYNRSWYIETLSESKTGKPFAFYFEPGTYTLRLEATTGEMCAPLSDISKLLTELNDLYHNIIMITGTSPDAYRDYNLEGAIPGLVETLKSLSKRLDACMESIKKITGANGTQAVSITTLSDQLRALAAQPKSISDRISNFYSNISAVSAWANSAFKQPLELDYIRVGTQKSSKLSAGAGIMAGIVSAVKSFVASFTTDYDSIGDSSNKNDIVVWIASGREQAESLKQLIDRDFTQGRDINVSLKLVQSGFVEAVVAGTGPDVALSIGMNQPVDYASRGILEPLDTYEGFQEHIAKNFNANALIPFAFKGNTYALPETQEFNMMFYRKDILEQLGMSIPNTWEQLSGMMAIFARNNMQIGITSLASTSAGVINTSFPKMIITMFMQHGVNIYSDDLRSTTLSSSESVRAFQSLTDFYAKYGLPIYFDASNRFRTGEMPIIIAPMSTYNVLAISAPEISGRWGIAMIPGTMREDGTINRADEFTATGCIMFKTASDKKSCWEFIKWWTSEQIQYDYGMELEAVLGISGRYLTANKQAFKRLPWDSQTADILLEQWEQVSTVPQVPGYYFVSRYLTNAISDVIVNDESPRVVLNRYSDTINAELKRKNKQLDALWNK